MTNPIAPNPPDPLDANAESMVEYFGAGLEPALLTACENRLREIRWFRTDWQRGGALTGHAVWIDDDGQPRDAMVKAPVPPRELLWMQRLQVDQHGCQQVVPVLYAGGQTLGPYDLAWIVTQRLYHGPLNAQWNGAEFDLLIDAAARFYAASADYPIDPKPADESWPQVLDRSRHAVRQQQPADGQHWNKALKKLQKKLARLLDLWTARPIQYWCHGDLHFGNAMTLNPPPDGPAYLFDLALVHPGNWVEDAVYLEHLFWSRPDRAAPKDLVKRIARKLKDQGMSVDADWFALADVRRVLLASAAPGEPASARNPAYVHAALAILDQTLPRLP